MSIPTKKCKKCNKEIVKPITESVSDWENRHFFCSRKCVVNKLEKNCKTCSKSFVVKGYRKDTAFFCSFPCARKAQFTSMAPNAYRVRRWKIAEEWRKQIFERDKYTCQLCGVKNEKGLGKTICFNADHIKPFALIVREHNLQSIEEFMSCEELWDISNGRTLCVPCHRGTPTFGRSSFYRNRQVAQS